jgi:hypothetical protein
LCVLFEFSQKGMSQGHENLCVDSSRPNETEDHLKKVKNGGGPQKNKKWKTTSKKISKLETTPKNNGKQPNKNRN